MAFCSNSRVWWKHRPRCFDGGENRQDLGKEMKKQQHSLVNLTTPKRLFSWERSNQSYCSMICFWCIRGNEEVARTPVFLAEEDNDQNIVWCLEDLLTSLQVFSQDQDHLTVTITTWSRTTKEWKLRTSETVWMKQQRTALKKHTSPKFTRAATACPNSHELQPWLQLHYLPKFTTAAT